MYIKIIVTTVGVPIWYDVSYKSVFHCLQISFSTALELVRIDSHVYLERSGIKATFHYSSISLQN